MPSSDPKKKVEVVGAIFQRGDTYAIFKKNNGSKYDGLWEFPGGKPEGDETPEQTLIREVNEELEVKVLDLALVGTESFEEEKRIIVLTCFMVTAWRGDFVLTEHTQVEFLKKDQLLKMPMVPADILFLPYL